MYRYLWSVAGLIAVFLVYGALVKSDDESTWHPERDAGPRSLLVAFAQAASDAD
jgi:hypothetical protein